MLDNEENKIHILETRTTGIKLKSGRGKFNYNQNVRRNSLSFFRGFYLCNILVLPLARCPGTLLPSRLRGFPMRSTTVLNPKLPHQSLKSPCTCTGGSSSPPIGREPLIPRQMFTVILTHHFHLLVPSHARPLVGVDCTFF